MRIETAYGKFNIEMSGNGDGTTKVMTINSCRHTYRLAKPCQDVPESSRNGTPGLIARADLEGIALEDHLEFCLGIEVPDETRRYQ